MEALLFQSNRASCYALFTQVGYANLLHHLPKNFNLTILMNNTLSIDCCDGSDEWANNVQKNACQNTCEILNHVARRETNRVDNLYALGFKIRAQLIADGKYLLLQKQVRYFHILILNTLERI